MNANCTTWTFRLALASVCCALAASWPLAHGDGVSTDGLFITVPNPITETAALQIERRVTQAVEREGRKLGVIVFDFNPQGKPAGTTNVFAALQLRDFVTRLSLGQVPKCQGVLTVAYVHGEVTDHTLLPVLACREVVMSSKGKLGQALRGQTGPLSREARQAYEDVARPWNIPELLPRLLESGRDEPLLDVEQAQKMGLCKARLETRSSVKDQYGLSPVSMRDDVLEGRTPVAWRIEVHGGLDTAKLNSMERRIKAAIRKQANLIILHLDCEGGETVDAASAAERLRRLTDYAGQLPVKTIAYVPPGKSLGAATFLAVGCGEIAMAPDAKLGGFGYLKREAPGTLQAQRKMLGDLAEAQGYHSAFFEAMLDPGLRVYQCRSVKRPGTVGILTETQFERDKADWQPGPVVFGGVPGEFPSLDAATARKYGIARYDDVTSLDMLYQRYGLTNVETSRDDWLDAVASFLREPLVNVLLIMVGVAGLILELKMPGFGVPGIVSAICFVLFFWCHAVAGQSTLEFTLLAVLLFVLGLALLAIEVFLLPGFGVTGVSGIVLIVASLVLVMLEQMPSSSQEWVELGSALTKVGIGLALGMTMAIVLARYLPHMPYANRLVLQPPEEAEESVGLEQTQGGLPATSLLGAIGVAATTLRPAGKAQFGEAFLDVIAEGDFVEAGSRVQVIEIEGLRIVVKAL